MADVLEQAKEISERVEDLVVNEVIAALCDRERETVLETAKLVCPQCAVGTLKLYLCTQNVISANGREDITSWRHAPFRHDGYSEFCRATDIWSRWPDYVPKAEEGKR